MLQSKSNETRKYCLSKEINEVISLPINPFMTRFIMTSFPLGGERMIGG